MRRSWAIAVAAIPALLSGVVGASAAQAASGSTRPAAPQSAVAVTGANHAMYVRTTPGGRWWYYGGYLLGPPAIASATSSHVTYFLATGGDSRLWVRTVQRRWTLFDSTLRGCTDPAATVVGSQLLVACRSSSGALFVLTAKLGGTHNPVAGSLANLGGRLGAGPAVVDIGNTVWFIVTGPVWDRRGDTLWARTLNGRFQRFAYGLDCASSPAAAYANGELFVGCNEARTTAFAYRISYARRVSQGVAGGRTIGAPGVALAGDGLATVYVEGTNGAVFVKQFDRSGPASGWIDYGGQVRAGAVATQISGARAQPAASVPEAPGGPWLPLAGVAGLLVLALRSRRHRTAAQPVGRGFGVLPEAKEPQPRPD